LFCFVFFIFVVLINIAPAQQPKYVDPLNLTAMACPAFPLCPLAITEAERGMPDILKRVRAVFEKVCPFKQVREKCTKHL
jgi:hypothetical protein